MWVLCVKHNMNSYAGPAAPSYVCPVCSGRLPPLNEYTNSNTTGNFPLTSEEERHKLSSTSSTFPALSPPNCNGAINMSLQLGLIVLPSDTDELNKVLAALSKLNLAGSVTTTAPKPTNTKGPAKEEPEIEEEQLAAVTAEQVKTAMTKVRDELGDETITELLTAFGATKLKDVAKDDWSALVAAANAALAPAGGGDDDDGFGLDDDDGFGLDDDDGDAPDAETVKLTVQAYAKKHGKEKAQAILTKFGLNTVRGLASADAATLTKIQAAAAKL